MDRRREGAFLVSLASAVVACLYRNFGVPVFRFWPLILADTILRLPGDSLLKLLDPGLPGWANEGLRIVFEAATLLLVYLGFGKFRAFLRPKPAMADSSVDQAGHSSPSPKPGRKWLTVAGWAAVALLIVNGRCGRGAVDLISILSGVHGYPLRATTDVRVQGEPAEVIAVPPSGSSRPLLGAVRLGPFAIPGEEKPRTGDATRPVMWFLFEDPRDLQRYGHTSRQIWELTTQPGTQAYISDGIPSAKDIGRWFKEISMPAELGRPSVPRRGHSYTGGNELSLIGGNLDLFLEKAGGGWWRERAGGFVVAVKGAIPEERMPTRPEVRFPPSILHFDRLADVCRLIGDLAGTEVVNSVEDDRPRVSQDRRAQFVADDDGGTHVEIEQRCSLKEIIEAIARSRRWLVEEQVGRFAVRGLRSDEVEARVAALFEARRAARSRSYPDASLTSFPPGCGRFVAPYLDDRDDEIIGYAIEVLEVVGVEPALPELLNIMNTGAARSGRRLTGWEARKAAGILMKAGESAGLSYFERSHALTREYVSIWYGDRVSVAPTAGALDIQDRLLARFRNPCPLLRPGKLRIRSLPSSLSVSDAAAAERLAVETLDAFSGLSWDEDASASLTFSADGLTASYSVEMSHYWGPLAAGGRSYYAELYRVGGRWLVTWIGSGGSWLS
ncbi:MAG TPA: hypothetical protein P5119_00015 [Candidatus Aminicenantes bacterium]|nr:hypothetical protein [Candidatus Aminicenantes bacterium]HRY63708.1 hypothetical protein [Candidatus Aminicenantes bacterium]HRZ73260.1 hypothetical protein [Candidatus Aminicenantes bacterium]